MSLGRVLVVDDDPHILGALRTTLRARNYDVLTAPNGETALELLAESRVDLVVLDLRLPGIDGTEAIRRLRSWTDVPVIMLTVEEDQSEKVAALDAGADDYVTKPFDMVELLARMRAVRRRASADEASPLLTYDELQIDRGQRLVRMEGRVLHLTPTEYRLLETLASRPGRLLTHTWLLHEIWGSGYTRETHYLRVYIRQLRRKLNDDPFNPRWIFNEPGIGYRWAAESSK